jgi:hypothetical protein
MVALRASEEQAVEVRTERPLTPREVATFERDGLVVVPGFFAAEEIAPLAEACTADPSLGGRLRAVADSDGNAQEVIGWSAPSDDYLGMVPNMARLIDGAATLLGKPVYHWHSKLSMKRPHAPGRWDWHQDYPYWYNEGCLWPDMLTAMIAVDRCTVANGCVKLVPGSQRLGRVDHVGVGQAVAFDPVRLELVFNRLPVVPIELEPGDTCFFHGNTLHASGGNDSDMPRTILHCSYNTIENTPFVTQGQEHHSYVPFEKLADDVLRLRKWRNIYETHNFWPRRTDGTNAYGYKVVKR